MKKKKISTAALVFIGVMAAIICCVTFFRFPLLGSKVHFANAMCLLSGLFLGPVNGGLAAGIGSMLYDVLFGGYDFIQGLITFASKFAMAWVCAMLARCLFRGSKATLRVSIACIIGALSYTALYMLKTFIYQKFVYGFAADAVWATMLSKLPASLINAAVAMIAAPILYGALLPVIRRFLPQTRR